jgi:hypothetical protein
MIQINKQYFQLKKENKPLPVKYNNIIIFDKFYNIVLNHGNHTIKLPTFILLLFFKVKFDIFQQYKLLQNITAIRNSGDLNNSLNGHDIVKFINDDLYMDHDFTVIKERRNIIFDKNIYESWVDSLYLPIISNPRLKAEFIRLININYGIIDINKLPIKNTNIIEYIERLDIIQLSPNIILIKQFYEELLKKEAQKDIIRKYKSDLDRTIPLIEPNIIEDIDIMYEDNIKKTYDTFIEDIRKFLNFINEKLIEKYNYIKPREGNLKPSEDNFNINLIIDTTNHHEITKCLSDDILKFSEIDENISIFFNTNNYSMENITASIKKLEDILSNLLRFDIGLLNKFKNYLEANNIPSTDLLNKYEKINKDIINIKKKLEFLNDIKKKYIEITNLIYESNLKIEKIKNIINKYKQAFDCGRIFQDLRTEYIQSKREFFDRQLEIEKERIRLDLQRRIGKTQDEIESQELINNINMEAVTEIDNRILLIRNELENAENREISNEYDNEGLEIQQFGQDYQDGDFYGDHREDENEFGDW